jgi:hypothetical protein
VRAAVSAEVPASAEINQQCTQVDSVRVAQRGVFQIQVKGTEGKGIELHVTRNDETGAFSLEVEWARSLGEPGAIGDMMNNVRCVCAVVELVHVLERAVEFERLSSQ